MADTPQDESRKAWIRDRVWQVKRTVTVYDMLRRNGIELSQVTDDREEQIQCPFHGVDNKPSARLYPPTDENPSGGIWCFVCQERWDIFGLWKKFKGDPDLPFMQVLKGIEVEWGISPAQAPESTYEAQHAPVRNDELEKFQGRWNLANDRLGWAKEAYQAKPDGLKQFLLHGQALDKVRWAVEEKKMTCHDGEPVVARVLELIRSIEASQFANHETSNP
jgi:hypothetical protein